MGLVLDECLFAFRCVAVWVAVKVDEECHEGLSVGWRPVGFDDMAEVAGFCIAYLFPGEVFI